MELPQEDEININMKMIYEGLDISWSEDKFIFLWIDFSRVLGHSINARAEVANYHGVVLKGHISRENIFREY